MKKVLPHVLRFVVLMSLQLLVLNNIRLFGFVSPYLYLVFIIMLPSTMDGWLVVLLSFLTGLTFDFFNGTLGLHAASCTTMGAALPAIIGLLFNKRDLKPDSVPELSTFGFRNLLIFVVLLVSIHHLVLFLLDAFDFSIILTTLKHAGMNVLCTVTFIIMYEFVIHPFRKS